MSSMKRTYPPEAPQIAQKVVEWSRTERGVEALEAMIAGQRWGEMELGAAVLNAMTKEVPSDAP